MLGNEVVHRFMFHQGCSLSRQITEIRNSRGKETEYFSSFCSLKILFKWYFCYYNLSTSKPSPLRSSESSHAMSRTTKSLTKIFLRLQTRLDHLQRIVKRTYWRDYVSRVDLSLSFLSSRKKNGNIANVLIIPHQLNEVARTHGKG